MNTKEAWCLLNGVKVNDKYLGEPIDYTKNWEFENVQCCDDCVLYIANGDVPPDDDTFEKRFELHSGGPQVRRMVFEHEHVVNYWMDLYILYDEDGNTEHDEFNTSKCETCNGLAGRRTTVQARVWEED